MRPRINVQAAARYEWVQRLAHQVKDGEPDGIDRAVEIMTRLVWNLYYQIYVLVPVPGRSGRADYTKVIAERVAKNLGIQCVDCLVTEPHEPLYDVKLRGGELKLPEFRMTKQFPPDQGILFIDNVFDTGTTARAVYATLNENLAACASYCVLAFTPTYKQYDNVKVHLPILPPRLFDSYPANLPRFDYVNGCMKFENEN